MFMVMSPPSSPHESLQDNTENGEADGEMSVETKASGSYSKSIFPLPVAKELCNPVNSGRAIK